MIESGKDISQCIISVKSINTDNIPLHHRRDVFERREDVSDDLKLILLDCRKLMTHDYIIFMRMLSGKNIKKDINDIAKLQIIGNHIECWMSIYRIRKPDHIDQWLMQMFWLNDDKEISVSWTVMKLIKAWNFSISPYWWTKAARSSAISLGSMTSNADASIWSFLLLPSIFFVARLIICL